MNDNISKTYKKRMDNLLKAINHIEPDNIPIIGNMTTWPLAYAGVTVDECLQDKDLYIKKCCEVYEDFYFDTNFYFGVVMPMETINILNSSTYFISDDHVTIQHKENTPMLAEEYPELIKDPIRYLTNTIFSRKFSPLNDQYPKNYEVLKNAGKSLMKFAQIRNELSEYAKENYGILQIAGAKSYPPFDVFFDRLRGFKGMSMDLRRCPELLMEAVEALFPYYEKMLDGLNGEYPFAVTTMHAPTFLKTKDFEKYFWPTYKKMLLKVYEKGSKTIICMEGNWERYYDYLNDLPKSCIVGMLEEDDIFEAKKRIGNNVAIGGSVPTGMLKYGTKKECIDYTKKVLDICAPGGGFVFTTEKALISGGDVNYDNLKAVNQFVHNYK